MKVAKLWCLAPGLILFSSLLTAACQTASRSLAAKTVPACERVKDKRGECDDLVGCYWNYDVGQCQAQ